MCVCVCACACPSPHSHRVLRRAKDLYNAANSLAALGDVVTALGSRHSVPYASNKLTQVPCIPRVCVFAL